MPDKTLQPATDRHELGYTLKSVRVSTGLIPANGQAEVAVPWPSPFPNTNYVVLSQVEESTAATDTLRTLRVVGKTADGCVVRVQNANATPRTGTLHVVGLPD